MEAEMDRGVIQVYYGEGHGKSTAAIGNAIRIASEGKSVIIIQFLKGKNENELTFLSRLEPEINSVLQNRMSVLRHFPRRQNRKKV